MTPDSIPSSYGLCQLMPILIMWDVHSSIREVLQRVSSGIRRYLHLTQVGFEGARMSSLGLPRPLCEVP